MDWFALAPALRAALLGVGTLGLVGGPLVLLMRGRDDLPWDARAALAAVPAGLVASGVLGIAGMAGALHPWPPLAAAATGLVPVAAMVLVAWGGPAIRARPEVELPPPPLPDEPGRLPRRPEDP